MKQLLYILLLAIFLFACERDVNIDLPDAKPVLVVTATIGTDMENTLMVHVGQSSPLQNSSPSNNSIITNATVTMNGLVFPYSSSNRLYKKDDVPSNFITPGQTYNLEVAAPGFETVTASCTIPEEMPLDFDVFNIEPAEYSSGYEFDVALNDNDSSTENYYALYGQTIYLDYQDEERGREIYFRDTENLFKSEFFIENKLIVNNIEAYGSSDELKRIELKLLRTDENFYRYFMTTNANDENPFGEPTIIYSNIENGLGVFAAYHAREKVIELP